MNIGGFAGVDASFTKISEVLVPAALPLRVFLGKSRIFVRGSRPCLGKGFKIVRMSGTSSY